MRHSPRLLGVLLVLCLASVAFAEDWPQWRGIHRDGKSPETGLLKQWPQGGPKLLWTYDGLGGGFATVSVADGMIYTTGVEGSQGVIYALDLDGKLKWKKTYGPDWTRAHPGTRSTPTIDDGLAYVMSGVGKIACFDAVTGQEKWSLNAVGRYRGPIPNWGVAESVLVLDDKVFCTPGGPGASVIALDKKTGSVLWTTKEHGEGSAYCSPILVKRGRGLQLVTMTKGSIVGIVPETGKLLWRHGHQTRYDVHAISPVFEDGYLYTTSGYGTGGVMLRMSADGRGVQQAWTDRRLDTHHGGVVLVDGYIYGSNFRGKWICLDLKTGRSMYETGGVGKGSITTADGMLYCYGERGTVGLMRASPKDSQVVSSFKITRGSGSHWAHPAIANGRLYIRHGSALMAFDIKGR